VQHKLGRRARLRKRRPDTSGDPSLLTWAASFTCGPFFFEG
jgi:hypothetical protein